MNNFHKCFCILERRYVHYNWDSDFDTCLKDLSFLLCFRFSVSLLIFFSFLSLEPPFQCVKVCLSVLRSIINMLLSVSCNTYIMKVIFASLGKMNINSILLSILLTLEHFKVPLSDSANAFAWILFSAHQDCCTVFFLFSLPGLFCLFLAILSFFPLCVFLLQYWALLNKKSENPFIFNEWVWAIYVCQCD